MAHQVETMAYTNQVPWHGLGFKIEKAPTPQAMLKAAKLDWSVDRRPLASASRDSEFVSEFDIPVDDFAALVRSSDNRVLDVVGSRYQPTQNSEVFGFFKEFTEAGGASMETAGSLKGGRLVWALAKLNKAFKLKGNDEIKGYLLIASPHEQGKSLIVKFTTVRVVCNNTITLALSEDSGNEWRMNHRNAFDDRMIARAKETLGIARDQLGEFEKNAIKLTKLKMSHDDAVKVLASIYQSDMPAKEILKDFEATAKPKLKAAMEALFKAPGADPGTGWGVLNATSYVSDHVFSRNPDNRLAHAWFGRTAKQKEKVLNVLINMTK
jgi:phage/plasmid-like protein (TIGR03299 family)